MLSLESTGDLHTGMNTCILLTVFSCWTQPDESSDFLSFVPRRQSLKSKAELPKKCASCTHGSKQPAGIAYFLTPSYRTRGVVSTWAVAVHTDRKVSVAVPFVFVGLACVRGPSSHLPLGLPPSHTHTGK